MRDLRGQRVLVTGGTGFIGSGLVSGLVKAGAKVRSLDDDSRGRRRRILQGEVELVTGDIRDPETVARAIEGVDVVCHLAYVNGTEFFYSKPEVVLEVAVKGMMNVLDGCIRHKVRRLVLASSSEVYQTPPSTPTDELVPMIVPDPLNPRYSYGGGKIISELLALNYGRKHFDEVLIFRPHNCYGPDMGEEHVIPQLSRKLAKLAKEQPSGAVELPIQGDGSETRAFVYIDDLVEGVLAIMRKGEHLGIYNIGTEEEVSIADLVRGIATVIGREVRIVPGELQKGGTPRRCPDIKRLRALGYEPKWTLPAGLGATVPWYLGEKP